MVSRRQPAHGLTHIAANRQPTMVDVGDKTATPRVAEAEARLRLPAVVARALQRSGHRTKKGPVFDTAILAGVMAAKRTSELIPFCHPLPLEHCAIEITAAPAGVITVHCRVATHHKTGVEMEALTGATIAALTIYDMCKALSHQIRIERVHLLTKTGGKREVRAGRTINAKRTPRRQRARQRDGGDAR
jgi:cyclic pyranopterin phosphate synthase